MNIKGGRVRVADAASSYIRLIRKDERRRQRIDRHARALIVIADGRHDSRHILSGTAETRQDLEGHHRAALRVIDPVDQIADIVQIARDLRQLHRVGVVAEGFENIACGLRHVGHVGKAVLRIAERDQRLVRLLNISADRFVGSYFLKSHKLLLNSSLSTKMIPRSCADCKIPLQ